MFGEDEAGRVALRSPWREVPVADHRIWSGAIPAPPVIPSERREASGQNAAYHILWWCIRFTVALMRRGGRMPISQDHKGGNLW